MSDIAPKCKKHDHNVLVLNNPCTFYQAVLISVGLLIMSRRQWLPGGNHVIIKQAAIYSDGDSLWIVILHVLWHVWRKKSYFQYYMLFISFWYI